MSQVSEVGGPNAPMPIGMPQGAAGAQPPKVVANTEDGKVDLAKPMPEGVNPFGPPGPGQEGYAAWQASNSVGRPEADLEAEVPRSAPLDVVEPPPVEAVVPQVPKPGVEYDPTPVLFMMEGGNVRCSYPIVIKNETGTCLVLGAKDPPPGVAVFEPSPSEDLVVVVGQGPNAVRYTVVSFGATFKFEEWNMTVFGIRDMTME